MNPEQLRTIVFDAVKALTKASAPNVRMSSKELDEMVQFIAKASCAVVLKRIAMQMRHETYDESAPSGACTDAIMVARDLGYRAGANDVTRRWFKLLEEATHAGP